MKKSSFCTVNAITDIIKHNYFWQAARLLTEKCINFTATSQGGKEARIKQLAKLRWAITLSQNQYVSLLYFSASWQDPLREKKLLKLLFRTENLIHPSENVIHRLAWLMHLDPVETWFGIWNTLKKYATFCKMYKGEAHVQIPPSNERPFLFWKTVCVLCIHSLFPNGSGNRESLMLSWQHGI